MYGMLQEFKAKLSGFSLARYIEAADMSSTQFGPDNFGEYRSPTTGSVNWQYLSSLSSGKSY